jgi:hypothetical protein
MGIGLDRGAGDIGLERQAVAEFLQQGPLETAQVGLLRAIGKAAQGCGIDWRTVGHARPRAAAGASAVR